ncbi:MAG TPA: hypothetical protein VFY85_07915 [Gemmatimonadaceae bacterium]|nr:hypothetical protein [Gemmatimonadaceae bacterium]
MSADGTGGIGAARSAGRSSTARGRRRLQRITEPSTDREFERASIAGDTQVPSTGDSAFAGRQEVARQREGIADAHAKLDVELPGEGEADEGGVGDAACDATPFRADFREREMGEQVIEPFERCSDGK